MKLTRAMIRKIISEQAVAQLHGEGGQSFFQRKCKEAIDVQELTGDEKQMIDDEREALARHMETAL